MRYLQITKFEINEFPAIFLIKLYTFIEILKYVYLNKNMQLGIQF